MLKPQIILSNRDNPRKRAPIVSAEQPICGICSLQFSRYTCPHCNLHYCSLTCYRGESHASCSEKFDRKSLIEEIETSKDKSGQEKRAMMEMLIKFEEQSKDAEEGDETDDDEGGDEERRLLEERLDGIDLDSLSPDGILALLSPAQRDAFDTTLRDPSKLSALVAAEFEAESPWWDTSDAASSSSETIELQTERPEIVNVELLPPLKIGEDGKPMVTTKLVYNVLAVMFAYSYTCRTLSISSFSSLAPGSSEGIAALAMIAQLVPFLTETSTVVLDDIGEAIEYVVSREKQDTIGPLLLAVLLRDVAVLLRPSPISTIDAATSSLSSHPAAQTLSALSDLRHLFTSHSSVSAPRTPSIIIRSPSKPTRAHLGAGQKLLFYMSFFASPHSSISSSNINSIADLLSQEAEKRELEALESSESIRMRSEQREKDKEMGIDHERERGHKIIEIE